MTQSNASSETVLVAADLVTYQAGSIVSRSLMKHGGGSVTAFAFDTGQELSEHTTPFDALIHVLDGVASVSIAGHASLVSAGGLIRLPANIPHGVRAAERFKMLLTMIRT